MKTDDSNDPGRLDRQKQAAVLKIADANSLPSWPPPSAPVRVARQFLAESYQRDDDVFAAAFGLTAQSRSTLSIPERDFDELDAGFDEWQAALRRQEDGSGTI